METEMMKVEDTVKGDEDKVEDTSEHYVALLQHHVVAVPWFKSDLNL